MYVQVSLVIYGIDSYGVCVLQYVRSTWITKEFHSIGLR